MTAPDRPQPEWAHCGACGALIYAKRLARNLLVCPDCGHHRRLPADERIRQLLDPGSYAPLGLRAESADVLAFTDSRPYPERLEQARRDTGLQEAVLCGTGRIEGHPLVLAVMDFRFLGGSLGSAVGELITQAAEVALAGRLPLLLVTTSGGARMQEGCLSLMQMAKTSQAIGRLGEAGLLTVSLITDPTYGGVAASFATNTDVLVAESGARMGFAGPRVIRQTIRQELPPGFQTARFLLEHGQVDMVVERRGVRPCLARLLATASGTPVAGLPAAEPILVRDPGELDAVDAWQVVRLARQVERPTTTDYLAAVFDSFVELHGDRVQGDCPAVVAGFARLGGMPVAVVGHQKGHDTKELVARNFGMPRPAGYRKALRVMRLAARLRVPVVTLVDTPGAHPGPDAEEHGQALAISQSLLGMAALPTPVVSVVTGEGGSGGALALAVADRVLVLENGTYSVISPEGCSAILWDTADAAPQAARALRITARELLGLGIVDAVVPEPPGGAHRDPAAAAENLRRALLEVLPELVGRDPADLVEARHARFRRFGAPAGPGLGRAAAGGPDAGEAA